MIFGLWPLFFSDSPGHGFQAHKVWARFTDVSGGVVFELAVADEVAGAGGVVDAEAVALVVGDGEVGEGVVGGGGGGVVVGLGDEDALVAVVVDFDFDELVVGGLAHEDALGVGSVSLNDVQPEQYRSLPWRCTNGRTLVIHRLCVHPEWRLTLRSYHVQIMRTKREINRETKEI